MTIALIAIPHERTPKIFWFHDRADAIAFAIDHNQILLYLPPTHFHQAIQFLTRTWQAHILIHSAADLNKVRNYRGHQNKPVRDLLPQLERRFPQDKPNADHT